MSTPNDLFTAALEDLGAIGAGETVPNAEDGEVARKTFNRLVGQLNRRLRTANFIRQQEFEFSTSQATYSIGKATGDPLTEPDFQVESGDAPLFIKSAQIVFTNVDPPVQLNLAVVNQDQYRLITIPRLSSTFPNTLYYQATYPNGTIRPWPAFPTETTFKLNLQWADQFTTVDSADVDTELDLPMGAEEALVKALGVKLWFKFPKRSNFQLLKRDAEMAMADFKSRNSPPPVVSTTDGIQDSCASAWNYQTRMPAN